MRRVVGVAREHVPPAEGAQRRPLSEPGAGLLVEEQRLEAAVDLAAVVQDDVVGEQLGPGHGEQRGGERGLARPRKPGEHERSPVDRDARGMQRVAGAARLELPPHRVVDGVVREGAQAASPERGQLPPVDGALQPFAPAPAAEAEVEAELEPSRPPAMLARDGERGDVVHPQPHHTVRPDVHVAVDHRVGLPAGEDRLGPDGVSRAFGPADADRDVGIARCRAGGLEVREVALEVPRERGMIRHDVEGDAAELYARDGHIHQTHRSGNCSGGFIPVSRKSAPRTLWTVPTAGVTRAASE